MSTNLEHLQCSLFEIGQESILLGPCWGEVSVIDEDDGGNEIIACEGHAEAWDWAQGVKSARPYILKEQ